MHRRETGLIRAAYNLFPNAAPTDDYPILSVLLRTDQSSRKFSENRHHHTHIHTQEQRGRIHTAIRNYSRRRAAGAAQGPAQGSVRGCVSLSIYMYIHIYVCSRE